MNIPGGESSADSKIRDLERAVAIAPADVSAILRLAQALQRTSRRQDAYTAWLQVRSAALACHDTITLDRARSFLAENGIWSQWRGGPRRDGCSVSQSAHYPTKLQWIHAADSPPAGAAATLCVTPWVVILATVSQALSRVLALDPDSGKQMWEASRQGSHSIGLALTLDRELLIAWLDSRLPELLMERRAPVTGQVALVAKQPMGSLKQVHGSAATGLAPLALNEEQLFVLASGQLFAFDPLTLQPRWSQPAGDSFSVYVQGDVVAVLGERGYQRLFETGTGRPIPHDQLRLPGASDLVRRCRSRRYSVMAVPARPGEIQCIDMSTGRRLSGWSAPTSSRPGKLMAVGSANQVALIHGSRLTLLSVPDLKAMGELHLDDAPAHDAAYLHDRLFVVDSRGTLRTFG